jgi:hypothetical protein
MLWLLGTICVLLGLLVLLAKRIYDRLWKVLDKAGAMLLVLDAISDSLRPVAFNLVLLREDSQDIRRRSSSLDHLKDIPEILRHLMALRELTYARQETEHDSIFQWPHVSPREEFQESRKKRRAATSKGEADQESADESQP